MRDQPNIRMMFVAHENISHKLTTGISIRHKTERLYTNIEHSLHNLARMHAGCCGLLQHRMKQYERDRALRIKCGLRTEFLTRVLRKFFQTVKTWCSRDEHTLRNLAHLNEPPARPLSRNEVIMRKLRNGMPHWFVHCP